MDNSLVLELSRSQFALTALYHWIFVPLTLGLSFIMAFMETMYVRTGNEEWKRITKFWMNLFAVNFALGLATGIILEFQFGTNWANFSWIVGDIFGAPLAIEGIMAFFLEATFFAVMFFGWNKVSKKIHLFSTWMVALGSNLSALWILVANGWMQSPVGMRFNLETARYEMTSFLDLILNPVAIAKFLHTISAGYVFSSLFVIGVSAWLLLKKKDILFAKRSMIIASTFGLVTSVFLAVSGDESAYQVAQKQPVKLAAMEGLYDGERGAGIVVIGQLNPDKKIGDRTTDPFIWHIEAPYTLSILGYRDINAFVPGINDLVYGNEEHGIKPAAQKIREGKIALEALEKYKEAKRLEDPEMASLALKDFRMYEQYLGYGYLEKPEDIVPPIGIVFYSFHIMVTLAGWFMTLFVLILFYTFKDTIEQKTILLRAAMFTVPLGYLAQQTGWIVAEVGRQPWAIQDLLPLNIAVSRLDATSIVITLSLFMLIFTLLLIAKVKIMFTKIKHGFKEI